MKKIIYLLTVLLMSTLFLSCTEEEVLPNSEKEIIQLSGTIQKGPFLENTKVTIKIHDLYFDFIKTINTDVYTDLYGAFDVSFQISNDDILEISASGKYFNEVINSDSDSEIMLYALSNTTNKIINANVLSFLEYSRIKHLIKIEGYNFAIAKTKAHRDVLNLFYVPADMKVGNFEEMDFTKGKGNEILIMASSILQGYRTSGELSTLIKSIAGDIEVDGKLDNKEIIQTLYNHAYNLNADSIRQNLINYYKKLGKIVDVPNFNESLNLFIEECECEYDISEMFNYPTTNKEGELNILHKDTKAFSANTNLSIFVSKNKYIPIKIKISPWDNRIMVDDESDWTLETSDSNYLDVFKSINNKPEINVGIVFPAGEFTIEYYENSEEVTYTKTIVVE